MGDEKHTTNFTNPQPPWQDKNIAFILNIADYDILVKDDYGPLVLREFYERFKKKITMEMVMKK
jgi:hypothetical protein